MPMPDALMPSMVVFACVCVALKWQPLGPTRGHLFGILHFTIEH